MRVLLLISSKNVLKIDAAILWFGVFLIGNCEILDKTMSKKRGAESTASSFDAFTLTEEDFPPLINKNPVAEKRDSSDLVSENEDVQIENMVEGDEETKDPLESFDMDKQDTGDHSNIVSIENMIEGDDEMKGSHDSFETEMVMTGTKRERESESDNEADIKFSSTLEELGYVFNSEGKLREKESGKPFTFVEIEGDNHHNQIRYEAIGEAVTKYVYELLQTEVKLKKIMVPVNPVDNEPQSFFFMSEKALENPDKLILFIHGSGVVRAGQWARRLIINDCLDTGTQLPFIRRAINEGYDVMVLNTNLNYDEYNEREIRDNSSPEEHANYVWDHFVKLAKAKHIAIVAHSYGGVVTVELIRKLQNERKRIFAIALTDSVHSFNHQSFSESDSSWMKKVTRNWVTHHSPVDTPVPSYNRRDVERVSAGHTKHEMTSWSSFNSIFKFLEEKYEAVINKPGKTKNGAAKNYTPKNGTSKNGASKQNEPQNYSPKSSIPPQASKDDL